MKLLARVNNYPVGSLCQHASFTLMHQLDTLGRGTIPCFIDRYIMMSVHCSELMHSPTSGAGLQVQLVPWPVVLSSGAEGVKGCLGSEKWRYRQQSPTSPMFAS